MDRRIEKGYAPFGIQNVMNFIVVTYAKQDKDKHDDVPGEGHGFVDVFDTSGNLVSRFAQHGRLNSPWGVALAPAGFGVFTNHLLIGNFGDGRINVFDLNGEHDGPLRGMDGKPIVIDGLWALEPGSGGAGTSTSNIYFTAGLNGEQDGLFGSLSFVGDNDGDENGGDHDRDHHHH